MFFYSSDCTKYALFNCEVVEEVYCVGRTVLHGRWGELPLGISEPEHKHGTTQSHTFWCSTDDLFQRDKALLRLIKALSEP